MVTSLAVIVHLVLGVITLGWLLRNGFEQDGKLIGASNSGAPDDLFREVKWDVWSVACVVLTFSVSALANAAGVGGGGFLVPLFNLVLGQSLKQAMALSQAAITGGALAAGVMALFGSHPLDNTQPLLDLEVALVLMPCLLLGVTLGVTLNQVFPDWLLVIILTVLLIILSLRTMRSGLRLRAAELRSQEDDLQESILVTASSEIPSLSPKAARQSLDDSHEAASSAEPPVLTMQVPSQPFLPISIRPGAEDFMASHPVRLDSSNPSSMASSPRSDYGGNDLANSFEGGSPPSEKQGGRRSEDIAGQSQEDRWVPATAEGSFDFQTPFQESPTTSASSSSRRRCNAYLWQSLQLFVLLAMWAAFLALQLLKDKFLTCTRPYFAVFGGQAAFSLLASSAFLILWKLNGRRRAGCIEEPLLPSPRPPPPRASAVRLAVSAFAVLFGGTLASLCGLGGGMVLGPVMLELGLHPMVAASSSLLLVGASSSLATIQFALVDRLPYGWAVIMFAVCVLASVLGVAGIGRYVRSSGRASVIVFLLVFTMATGGILTAVFGGIRAADSLADGGRAGFLSLCEL